MEAFTLKVIGFSRVFYEGEALQLQLPIQDGLMGIMAHHEAAVIGIVPGTLRLQQPDGEWQTAVVDAGFARVGDNAVSVLVEEALRPEEIDEERERRALAEAQEELRQKHSILECQNAEMTILRSLARLHAQELFLTEEGMGAALWAAPML